MALLVSVQTYLWTGVVDMGLGFMEPAPYADTASTASAATTGALSSGRGPVREQSLESMRPPRSTTDLIPAVPPNHLDFPEHLMLGEVVVAVVDILLLPSDIEVRSFQ